MKDCSHSPRCGSSAVPGHPDPQQQGPVRISIRNVLCHLDHSELQVGLGCQEEKEGPHGHRVRQQSQTAKQEGWGSWGASGRALAAGQGVILPSAQPRMRHIPGQQPSPEQTRECGVFSLGIFHTPLDTILSPVLWDGPAAAGRLDQMSHRGSFQPDPFCHVASS